MVGVCTAYIVPLEIRQIELQTVLSNSNVVVGFTLFPVCVPYCFHRRCPDPQSFRDLIRTVHPKVRRKCTCTKKKKWNLGVNSEKTKKKIVFRILFFLKKISF